MTLQKIVENFIRENNTNQENYSNHLANEGNKAALLSFFLIYLGVYLLLMVLGQFLWNNYVVDMFSIARPVNSIWHIVALSILVKLVIY
jgi:hypothetical protein